MTKINDLLREGDPLVREPSLARSDVEGMRRQVLSARATPRETHGWTWTLTLATALTVLVAAGVGVTRRSAEPPRNASAPAVVVAQQGDDTEGRRQLQFATPGGTRVIWVFNDSFGKGVQQ